MKIKKEIIKELESLNPNELLLVYELILSFKGRARQPKEWSEINLPTYLPAYRKVRSTLKQCKGSLSEDILSAGGRKNMNLFLNISART